MLLLLLVSRKPHFEAALFVVTMSNSTCWVTNKSDSKTRWATTGLGSATDDMGESRAVFLQNAPHKP